MMILIGSSLFFKIGGTYTITATITIGGATQFAISSIAFMKIRRESMCAAYMIKILTKSSLSLKQNRTTSTNTKSSLNLT